MDVVRQQQLRVLARQADERWAAKGSFLDKPAEKGQPLPATQLKDPSGYVEKTGAEIATNLVAGADNITMGEKEDIDIQTMHADGNRDVDKRPARGHEPKKEKTQPEDPWKQKRGGPSEAWQPKAWDGGTTNRR